MNRRTGTVLGGFRLQARLGGQMGEVWKAARLDDPAADAVVLKIAEDRRATRLLAREAELPAGLDHPRLALPVERHLDAVPAYLVMRHWAGGSLRGRLDGAGPLKPAEAAEMWADVLEGLAVLHAAGLAHGDLKPENVLLDDDGRAALGDFGLTAGFTPTPTPAGPAGGGSGTRAPVEFAGSSPSSPRTAGAEGAAGRFAGTWHYMSPELRAGGSADARSDVWAAGVMLFEMLTGRRPEGAADLKRAEVPLWARTLLAEACSPLADRPPDAGVLREQLTSLYNLGARAALSAPMPRRAVVALLPARDEWWRSGSSSAGSSSTGAMAALRLSPAAGEHVPGVPYRLVERLGRSRFADTWLATDDADGGRVVVKLLTDPQYVNNLRFDRRPVAGIRHANLAACLAFHPDGETPHVAFAHVPGTPLRDKLVQGRTDPATAARIIGGILAGLAAAHRTGVAHHNLRPENVRLAAADGRAVVTDLALGRAVEETTCQMCMSGIDWSEFAGYWRYLAPEQESGAGGGPAADVFAAALMWCELLIGALPPALLRERAIEGLPDPARSVIAVATAPLEERFTDAGAMLRAMGAGEG